MSQAPGRTSAWSCWSTWRRLLVIDDGTSCRSLDHTAAEQRRHRFSRPRRGPAPWPISAMVAGAESLEETALDRLGHRRRARGDVECAQDVGDVAVNGVLADGEYGGY